MNITLTAYYKHTHTYMFERSSIITVGVVRVNQTNRTEVNNIVDVASNCVQIEQILHQCPRSAINCNFSNLTSELRMRQFIITVFDWLSLRDTSRSRATNNENYIIYTILFLINVWGSTYTNFIMLLGKKRTSNEIYLIMPPIT